ncbi:MAG: trimethylamine methyltransferase family protein, partial [Desulfotignum balticum]|nr:trimethylamine methyltransferase family protein [Desulfotignum balticum]
MMTRKLPKSPEPSLENLEKLDGMARRILSEIGIRILSRPYLDLLSEKGISMKADRAVFSPDQVDALLGSAPAQFTLHGIS